MPKDTHSYGHYFVHPAGHQAHHFMHSMSHTSAFAQGMPGFAGFFTGLLFLLLIIFCLSMVVQRLRNTHVYMGSNFRQSESQLYIAPHAYQHGYQAAPKKQWDAPEEEYPHDWQAYEAPQASYPELPRQRS